MDTFLPVTKDEVERKSMPIPEASEFGPRYSKANGYVPARYRLMPLGEIDPTVTRTAEQAAQIRMLNKVRATANVAGVGTSYLLPDGTVRQVEPEDVNFPAEIELDPEAVLLNPTENTVVADIQGLYDTSTKDPISEVLTAPSNAGKSYYSVLRSMIAAIRKQLIENSAPKGGMDYFTALDEELIGPAFPMSVKMEDPVYFVELEKRQKEAQYKQSEWHAGIEKAYAAPPDKLVYVFDRRPIPPKVSAEPKKNRTPAGKGHAAVSARRSHALPHARDVVRREPPEAGLHPAVVMREEQERGKLVTAAELAGTSITRTVAAAGAGARNKDSADGLNFISKLREECVAEATSRGEKVTPSGFEHATGPGASTDTYATMLRWSEQQRLMMERRNNRVEHILSLLAREMHEEAGRQTRLRFLASKYAVNEARARGLDWSAYSMGIDDGSIEAAAVEAEKKKKEALAVITEGESERPTASLQPERFSSIKTTHTLSANASTMRQSYTRVDLEADRFKVLRERFEAADSIMRILEQYRLIPATVSADYLRSTTEEVEAAIADQLKAQEAVRQAMQEAKEARRLLKEKELRRMGKYVPKKKPLPPDSDEEKEALEDDPGSLDDAGDGISGKDTTKGTNGGSNADGDDASATSSTTTALVATHPDDEEEKELPPEVKLRMLLTKTKPVPLQVPGSKPENVNPPSSFFVREGGATPYFERDEVEEAEYSPSKPGNMGLSSYNIRPAQAREAVRQAIKQDFPQLYDGYQMLSRRKGLVSGTTSGPGASGGSMLGGGVLGGDGATGLGAPLPSPDGVADGKLDAASRPDSPLPGNGNGDEAGGVEPGAATANPTSAGENTDTESPTRRVVPPPFVLSKVRRRLGYVPKKLAPPESEDSVDEVEQLMLQEGGVSDSDSDMEIFMREARRKREQRKKDREEAIKKRNEVPDWIKAMRPSTEEVQRRREVVEKRREKEHADKQKQLEFKVMAGGVDSTNFAEVENELTKFHIGGRPVWQEHVLREYELSNLRESTDMQLNIVQRRPKEPVDGRYSHLMGRYFSAMDMRIQAHASRRIKYQGTGATTGQTPAESVAMQLRAPKGLQ